MSHFNCEKCGFACYDSPQGYTTGCVHYYPDTPAFRKLRKVLADSIKSPDAVTWPLQAFGGKSLLDLWNAGQYTVCEAVVHGLRSGEPT